MNRKMLVLAVLIVLGAAKVQAQDFKLGYTFLDGIVFAMPEIEGINSQLETTRSQLGKQVQSKEAEMQTKMNELQQMAQDPNANQLVLQERENEIRSLQQAYQQFTQQAEQALSAKQAELFNPVYQKVQEAVEEVRKEKGFAMIINAQAGAATSIVLASDDAYDITKDVFDKLGVEMPEPPAEESADGGK